MPVVIVDSSENSVRFSYVNDQVEISGSGVNVKSIYSDVYEFLSKVFAAISHVVGVADLLRLFFQLVLDYLH